MRVTIQKDLEDRLKDKEFAQVYGENIAKAEIAVALAQARRRKNLTQEDLANILGKSQSYVAKLESGDANPTIGNVGRILASIGLRISANFRPLSSGIENKGISFESVNSNENLLYWFAGQANEIGVADFKENVINDKDLEYIWR